LRNAITRSVRRSRDRASSSRSQCTHDSSLSWQ
jgi:hypothetical protein